MPVYEYKCEAGHEFEKVHRIAHCDDTHHCTCGAVAHRQMVAPRVRGDYPGYQCPITGSWIEGRKAHNENLAKHGCRVLEGGEREAMTRRKAEADSRLEKAVEETAIMDLMTMPDTKFEVLAGELVRGGDTEFVRSTAQEG